jgi:DNA-directed RNA polymerase specialized sigma24 family protein
MFEGSPLSSEADPLDADPLDRTAVAGRDPHFPLTLSRLQLLYNQTRSSLLGEAQTKSADLAFARDVVQDAFAAAARNRFSFQSEKDAVAWLRGAISARTLTHHSAASPSFEAPYDWADVLRRANISTSTPNPPATPAHPSRWSLLTSLRSWARRTSFGGESHRSSA